MSSKGGLVMSTRPPRDIQGPLESMLGIPYCRKIISGCVTSQICKHLTPFLPPRVVPPPPLSLERESDSQESDVVYHSLSQRPIVQYSKKNVVIWTVGASARLSLEQLLDEIRQFPLGDHQLSLPSPRQHPLQSAQLGLILLLLFISIVLSLTMGMCMYVLVPMETKGVRFPRAGVTDGFPVLGVELRALNVLSSTPESHP
ncbi:hypothetical protein STEG23_030153 [Scotinomys teguina]